MSGRPQILGVGELLWDCFGEERRPGGAPANVAFHATQLGYAGRVVSRVGDDPAGHELVGYLEARGLEASGIQVDRDHPTGRVDVDVRDPSSPSYRIHEGVAWDHLAFEERLGAACRSAAALCVGTLAQRSPVSRATIARCLAEAGPALVVFDVNLRPPYYDRSVVEGTLERTDVVKLNLDEVKVLAELLAAPAEPVAFCRELMRRYPLRLACVTRGAHGCLLVAAAGTEDVSGREVQVADAVGAGDAFTAGLIVARLRGWPLAESARFANHLGALVATRDGAMPDLGAQLHELVRSTEAAAGGDQGPR